MLIINNYSKILLINTLLERFSSVYCICVILYYYYERITFTICHVVIGTIFKYYLCCFVHAALNSIYNRVYYKTPTPLNLFK